MSTSVPPQRAIEYPDSDGQPIADNTLQYRWVTTIAGGLDALFRDRPDVFVAGDLLWYPVEGDNKTRLAPDALVAFGRPKGYRGSYRQWEEGGVAPQVVFEVLSPGNRPAEMERKLRFYEKYGVQEYYLYDPDHVRFSGWTREGNQLRPITQPDGWTSPQLGIRFDLSGEELANFAPDGQRFLSFVELAERAEQEHRQAEQAQRQAAREQRRATHEQRRADRAQQQAEQAQQQAERLRAQLRALGIEPEG